MASGIQKRPDRRDGKNAPACGATGQGCRGNEGRIGEGRLAVAVHPRPLQAALRVHAQV